MQKIIALIEAFIPAIIEFIKARHPDKCHDEHVQMVHDLLSEQLNKKIDQQ